MPSQSEYCFSNSIPICMSFNLEAQVDGALNEDTIRPPEDQGY